MKNFMLSKFRDQLGYSSPALMSIVSIQFSVHWFLFRMSNSNAAISLVLNSEHHHKLQTSRYEIIVLFQIQRDLDIHWEERKSHIRNLIEATNRGLTKEGTYQTGGNFSYKRSK